MDNMFTTSFKAINLYVKSDIHNQSIPLKRILNIHFHDGLLVFLNKL